MRRRLLEGGAGAMLRFVPFKPIARADAPADPEVAEEGEYRNPAGLFWVVASTEEVASDGHRLLSTGWDFSRFEQNPIMPWAHTAWPGMCGGRSGAPMHPIGNVPGRRINGTEKRLEVGLNFYEARSGGEDGPYIYPLAHLTAQQFRHGMLRMVSVGFDMVERLPLADIDPTGEYADYRDEDAYGVLSLHTMLFEVSPVPIGADPGALALGSSESRVATFARAWMDTDDGRAFMRDCLGEQLRRELDRLAKNGRIQIVAGPASAEGEPEAAPAKRAAEAPAVEPTPAPEAADPEGGGPDDTGEDGEPSTEKPTGLGYWFAA